MKTKLILMGLTMILFFSCQVHQPRYEATWESLEKVNPVPEWFKDAKFGIYFHWGVYSTPAYANEWYPRSMHQPGTREFNHHVEKYGDPTEWPYHYFITGAEDKAGNYVQFAPQLKSEGGEFDPEEWAELFAKSGAKYAGPVAEHHDGYSMWDSKVNSWNAKNTGPGIDLVDVLVKAIRQKEMKIILSMHHAFNITGFYENVAETDDPNLQLLYGQMGKETNEEVWLKKHQEIIDNFQPDIIWQDFNLTALSEPLLLEFLAYYYNSADKLGKEVVTTYKDALNQKVAVLDYERGGPVDITPYYWLTDDAISSSSWCYTEGIGYYSPEQVLHGFFDRVSKNGNLLLNISPRADGSIPQEQKDILLAMGNWLGKYGEAIYQTRAWQIYGEGPTKMGSGHHHAEGASFRAPTAGTPEDIRFTRSKDNTTLYAIILGWPESNDLLSIKTLAKEHFNIEELEEAILLTPDQSANRNIKFHQDETALHFQLLRKPAEEMAYVIKMRFNGEIPEFKQ